MPEVEYESELKAASRLLEGGHGIAASAAYKELVNKGSGWAALQLGYMFENGKGVTISAKDAEAWYKTSKELGCAHGWFYLARLYENTHQQELAFSEMERAATDGFLPAVNRLGLYYERGVGCTPNHERAKHYREFAAAQGHLYAKRWQSVQLIRQGTILSFSKGIALYVMQSWRILKLGMRCPADLRVQI